jgi:hypothetical protein
VRRYLVPLVVALPLLTALPAAASSSGTPVHVTAVIRDAHGHLSFRHGSATGAAGGRQLAGRWRGERSVLAAAVDTRIHTTGTPDPLATEQWGLSTLRSSEVGDATGQVVAVIDTGVDATHPDLSGVVLPGTDIVAGAGNGGADPNGHGTHVAGIVAAVAGNGIGGAGLAQGARILPVRVMDTDGSGWDSDAAEGMVWAVDHGATVINLSFGGPDPSPVLLTAVNYALSRNVPVVVSAGNEGDVGDPVEYPAADTGVIAVGAVDRFGVRPTWSSSGSHLALVAPGVDITSTTPGGTYATWDGTSMAAPFVSAAVALLRHAQPALTAGAVRRRLMDTADDLGPAGFDSGYGAGRVDVVAAEAATAPLDVAVVPAPVLTARISASRPTTPYAGAVTVSGRVLADGEGIPGLPVRLERQVGSSWVETRTGTSGDGGLASWLLHPDRTTYYRFVGTGWSSSLLRIDVTPTVSLRVSRTGAAGRVLPPATSLVRFDVRRGTSWAALTTVRSLSDGSYRLSRTLSAGTVLRAVSSGVASAPTRVP